VARLLFSEHARDRMLAGGVNVADVEAALASGETIEEYEDGTRLVLGRAHLRPLHLVVRVDDRPAGTIFVITVYEPDPARWDPTFRERRPR
jgi:hypothetical protein